MIFPQPLLLLLCTAIPGFLIYVKKRTDLSIVWLALIIVCDIFNSQLYMNLAALLIFGMTVTPYLWFNRKDFYSNRAVQLLSIYFIYLVLLGIYHGFVLPWPDLSGVRSFKDQAQWRTILHLGRTVCEWFVVLFLVLEIERKPKQILSLFLRTMFFASIALAMSALLEKALQIDFYHFFTRGRALLLPDRPRGFAYEPRGLSQNLAYAMLLTPFVPLPRWKYFFVPLFAFVAIYFTISFSGIAVLVSGLILLGILFPISHLEFIRRNLKSASGVCLAVMVVLAISISALPKSSLHHMHVRLDYLFDSGVAEKLEVFDAASVNFLDHHPKYYLLGTGPGLIYLPAGDYILERDKYIWNNHFEALPHLGAVLIISNSGLLGLCIFILILGIGGAKKRKTAPILFVIGFLIMGIFMIQIRYFYILGMACLLVRNQPLREEALT